MDVMATDEGCMQLQHAYRSLTQKYNIQLVNSFHQLNPQHINGLVDLELKRLQANYAQEEEKFVEQMLEKNPVIVERRILPKIPTNSNNSENSSGQEDEMQRKRAESCRRSRINGKIRRAKTRFRHKFITNKMMQTASMLDCIRDIVVKAERQLLSKGFTPTTLQQLRSTFGVDLHSVTVEPAIDMTQTIDL